MKIKKSGLRILAMVLLNRNTKVLYELESRVKNLERKINEKKKRLLMVSEDVNQKRASFRELTKNINVNIKQKEDAKRLKKELKKEQLKRKELEIRLGRMRNKVKTKPSKLRQTVERSIAVMPVGANDFNGMKHIKEKFPNLPKNQLERIEIERTIARSLMKNNSGSFYISQILRSMEKLYSKYIKPNDRIMLLNEVKSWIERDPLCKVVKATDKIQHYTFI